MDASAQRARDADARAILEGELRKAESRLAGLKTEFNNGEPEKRGPEFRNHQMYLDRVAELRAGAWRLHERWERALEVPKTTAFAAAHAAGALARLPDGAQILVMTHSHLLDMAIVQQLLRRGDFGWLGLIGSLPDASYAPQYICSTPSEEGGTKVAAVAAKVSEKPANKERW